MNNSIKLAIAEDHQLVRQGLVSLLNDEINFEVTLEASNGSELLEGLRNHPVDIILLDLDMPIVSGHEALKIISTTYPEIKVIIISMHYTEDFITKCIADGARGFLPKNCDIELVVDAINVVNAQGYYFDDTISPQVLDDLVNKKQIRPIFSPDPLTKREEEIVRCICQGQLNKEIAENLFISVKTVEAHRRSISEKTHSKNVAGVIIYALSHGIYSIHT